MGDERGNPPFPDDDRTVLRPRPGASSASSPPPSPPSPSGPSPAARLEASPIPPPPSGMLANPLLEAAMPLLVLARELRHTIEHPDPAGLLQRCVDFVTRFEEQAQAAGARREAVLSARYVLCAFLDEVVLGTPWGGHSPWSRQGLLITFHKEAWGGEKFFLLLERLLASPGANRDLLELMYVLLALGFEGRYRPLPDGQATLERLRRQVYLSLRELRGEPEPALSPHWRGTPRPQRRLAGTTVLWVSVALSAALLLGLYVVLVFLLNQASDPIYFRLAQLNPSVVATPSPAPTPPPPVTPAPAPRLEHRLTLRELLADQIAAGRLDVVESPETSRVILFGDGMFASGSDRIRPEYLPVMERVAQALRRIPGRVLITGHTDDRPIRTLRFPSNWHLSQARAEAALRILAERTGQPERFYAEGRAHTEPLVPNDTPRHRARNRRVEITLYYVPLQSAGPPGNTQP